MNSAQQTDPPRVPMPSLAMDVLLTMHRRERIERERRQRQRICHYRTWKKTLMLPILIAVLGGVFGAVLARYELLPTMLHHAALSKTTLAWTLIATTASVTAILGIRWSLSAFLPEYPDPS